MSKSIAVVGMQWGDEGKGKVVDFLAEDCSVSVRFNGGNNAGHSVETKEFGRKKVHLLPSSSFRKEMTSVLGNGMVLDLDVLRREAEYVKNVNPDLDLIIDSRIHTIHEEHKTRDAAEENSRKVQIGTTRSGNGPAYSDKYARKGKRLCDILNESDPLYKYLGDVPRYLDEARKSEKGIIFAGAHGILLDIDYGDYPYCTSSNCIPAAIGTGAGYDTRNLTEVVGVVKAYSTRVGSGPFLAEFDAARGNEIRDIGKEYGTTTGRPRKIGALDLPLLHQAIRVSHPDYLVMTMSDVLSCLDEVPVAIAYDGEIDPKLPLNTQMNRVNKVTYAWFKGWKGIDISECKKESDLPKSLIFFLYSISHNLGTRIKYLSTGPRRDQMIELGG